LKTVLAGLFTKLEQVGKDAAEDTSIAGVVANGLQTMNDAVGAVEYFNTTVLPVVEGIYGQIKTDTGSQATSPAPALPVAVAAVAGSHTLAAS